MQDNTDKPDYRGKRALMLLRVSTPGQEEKYGLPSQEKEVREKLIEPLQLRLDELQHVIRDTYTGLEFKERPALTRILNMAQRREFDVLVMDVLDRLGRRGIEREIYRLQLREHGVRILTTDPSDYADDDTMVGELVRFVKGIQAEQELHNTRRRTMHGKRAKAEGRQKDGSLGIKKVVGTGHRLYGYKYVLNDKGKREGFTPNLDIILVEADGTEWTEVKVVIFIFESSASGVPFRQIAKILNEKGIPSPYAAKGIHAKRLEGKTLVWQRGVISRVIWQSGYWGELVQFKTKRIGKVPGIKDPRRKTTAKEQVITPIPLIITKELAEKAQQQALRNRKLASRNNRNPEESLLRGGLIKCGYCESNLVVRRDDRRGQGNGTYALFYRCETHATYFQRCESGCSIPVSLTDEAAWEKAVEIIRDPSQVDERVNAKRSADPTAGRRKQITAKIAELQQEQANMEENLARMMRKGTLNPRTEERLTKTLNDLALEEQGYQDQLAVEEDERAEWQKVQENLDALHAVCAEMRENLDDPDYTLSYQRKRELLEFFGITVIAFKAGHKPPYKVTADPPSIVMHRSTLEYHQHPDTCRSSRRTIDSLA